MNSSIRSMDSVIIVTNSSSIITWRVSLNAGVMIFPFDPGTVSDLEVA